MNRGAVAGVAADVRSGSMLLKKSFCTGDKISFGCTRDFRVKMWRTSLPEDKTRWRPR
jgi:hypothetical protein